MLNILCHLILAGALALLGQTSANAQSDDVLCTGTTSDRTRHKFEMTLANGYPERLVYQTVQHSDSETGGHECFISIEGDEVQSWLAASANSKVLFLRPVKTWKGEDYTPTIKIEISKTVIRTSFDIIYAHARFCGASGHYADTVTFNRKTRACQFK